MRQGNCALLRASNRPEFPRMPEMSIVGSLESLFAFAVFHALLARPETETASSPGGPAKSTPCTQYQLTIFFSWHDVSHLLNKGWHLPWKADRFSTKKYQLEKEGMWRLRGLVFCWFPFKSLRVAKDNTQGPRFPPSSMLSVPYNSPPLWNPFGSSRTLQIHSVQG